ncbi:Mu transposase domain-containing protein [Actinopolymorpha pittospori]|uniref:Transposase n=1 Tax=Actinopolymorpha pittospori TaxID=648752 RepID=A0A927N3Z6_9ACTN|nr:DDE-type integrase/transposase/recombinase [Actinopolymorpha pittospori]MBE1608155.1 transposase [Actinopolymorpha pittospori]
MLTREDDVDAHALHRRGWTISAIARHLGHDRKTIRAYLNGDRVAGQRRPAGPDPFEPFIGYCRERLVEDPHLWAQTLFDEVTKLGYARSYPSFTRQLRTQRLRPHCEPCSPAKGRPAAVIEHPAGEETQWDWVELPDPPQQWGWGGKAFLLVGALAHSGRWRGVLAASMDQPHLVDALDRTTRALGGLSRVWRFDRMATVCHPASGRITSSFAAVAKHYGVQVAICPPRRGNRKGVVEKANHTAAQRWWRTLPDELTPEQAQASLDDFCQLRADVRIRATADGKASVAALANAEGERLRPVPARPFPATITVQRLASAQALVAYRGNRYSVPPELAHATVTVSHRLGAHHLDIATTNGTVIAQHRLAIDGAGVMVRDHGHVHALNHAALTAFTDAAPHRRKQRIPPGPAARAAADQLRTRHQAADPGRGEGPPDQGVVIDLARYAAAAKGRNTLT